MADVGTWFERVSVSVILVNCVTLGMFQPCADIVCTSTRCLLLETFDHVIFVFFTLELCVKVVAMGLIGKKAYLGDAWNRLDLFIVVAGNSLEQVTDAISKQNDEPSTMPKVSDNGGWMVLILAAEYVIGAQNFNLSAIRTVRVLRPLRAINRIPSMRILVTLLIDTLPMLGNVLLLTFFIFFIFGIIAVQLWSGLLRQRCLLQLPDKISAVGYNLSSYFVGAHNKDYICSRGEDDGMAKCNDLPRYIHEGKRCNETVYYNDLTSEGGGACINWNQYYTVCQSIEKNPFQGAISFDNVAMAWVAIFQVISLEGWAEIMYSVQDSHSFWTWIYFVLLIIIGSFLMVNLCLVVIATQFSETKSRELEDMKREKRLRRLSSGSKSSLGSNASKQKTSCYGQIIDFLETRVRQTSRQCWRQVKHGSSSVQPAVVVHYTTGDNNTHINTQNKRWHRRRHFSDKDFMTSLNYAPKVDDYFSRLFVNTLPTRVSRAPLASPEISDLDIPASDTNARCLGVSDIYRRGQSLSDSQCSVAVSNCAKTSSLKHELVEAYTTSEPATENVQKCVAIGDVQDERCLNDVDSFQIFQTTCGKYGDASSVNGNDNVEIIIPDASQDMEGANSENAGLLTRLRNRTKTLIQSDYFDRCLLALILLNTLCMGVEYHGQPDVLTQVMEYLNVVFTVLFLVEMLLKVFAEGILKYIKIGFNVFDGFLVLISLFELISGGDGSLSIMRTFRLLRILKLVKFFKALEYQLAVMFRTMDTVVTFFALLSLFIFIFSILGMNLFGCKFCEPSVIHGNAPKCVRKNFDSLLWASMTVFQILTQEDWNEVLYNGMAKTSPWAALYFIVLMMFGNYVLFNLLVAIMVEGFATEAQAALERVKEEKRRMNQEQVTLVKALLVKAVNTNKVKGHAQFIVSPSRNMSIENIKDNKEKERCMQRHLSNGSNSKTDDNATKQFTVAYVTSSLSESVTVTLHQSNSFLQSYPQSHSDSSSSGDNTSESQGSFVNSLSSDSVSSISLHNQSECAGQIRLAKWDADLLGRRRSKNTNEMNYDSDINSMPDTQSSLTKNIFGKSQFLKRSGSANLNNHPSRQTRHGAPRGLLKHHQNGLTKDGIVNTPSQNDRVERDVNFQNVTWSMEDSVNILRHSPVMVNLQRLEAGTQTCSSEYLQTHQSETTKLPEDDDQKIAGTSLNKNEMEDSLGDADGEEDRGCTCSCSWWWCPEPRGCFKTRSDYSFYILSYSSKVRRKCISWTKLKFFDSIILFFIALNCITLAVERPNIPADSMERHLLTISNYIFTVIFTTEMTMKIIAVGLIFGRRPYLRNGWNVMDGSLVVISLIDIIISLASHGSRIFGILRVFRLLRTLRPLRVINRAPGLKLVVQTLLASLRPIGNIILICFTFFIIFGILGVQLLKGELYHCQGPDLSNVFNRTDCTNKGPPYRWVNQKYNFDNLGQALLSLFVLSSKDGWVNIMYTGIDAVGVDQQPRLNYNEWRLVYFISFLLLVGFFVLNMFVGVVVENFHSCQERLTKETQAMKPDEEKKNIEDAQDRKLKQEYKRLLKLKCWSHYSRPRLVIYSLATSKYFEFAIAAIIGLNIFTMALEYHHMPKKMQFALKVFNLFFTSVFVVEAIIKIIASGFSRYLMDGWNRLDILIVILSLIGIVFEEMKSGVIPINPSVIRMMRVLRIARVLKLLKVAKSVRALLDTVLRALPEVGNLGLLFFLLFFIFAALGVELFGRVGCSENLPCDGLSKHAHFQNFGMAFLTLFRIATGDNWSGILKDMLRDGCDESDTCVHMCCVSHALAQLFFILFVLSAQFVLVNVVVAVLMKHLEDRKIHCDDVDSDIDVDVDDVYCLGVSS